MSASLRRFHATRIRSDSAALSEVQDALKSTLARRAEAQRVLDEVTREAVALEELQESLTARLAASRYDSIRLCVSALPDDILRCIFEEACRDNVLTTGPSALAAVLYHFDPVDSVHQTLFKKWRRVALSFAALWSSIHVIADSRTVLARMKAYHDYVVTHLSRSRAATLDVLVLWNPPGAHQYGYDEIVKAFSDIIEALGGQVSRWRKARLCLSDEPEDLSTIGFLKGPTPRLTELVLTPRVIGPRSGAAPKGGYLPYAPVLQRLELRDGGIACCSRSAFPLLTKLKVDEHACTEEDLYQYLVRAPSLVELEVSIAIAHAPPTEITLPELQSLKVGIDSGFLLSAPLSNLLRLPKLERLFLDCAPEDGMTPFLTAALPTVRSLRLGQRLKVPHLAVLGHLQNVEELQLSPQAGRTVDRSVLDQLATNEPPIWPRLSALKEVPFVNGIGDRLLGLISARNPPLAAGETQPDVSGRPCRLREIAFRPGDSAPEWLVQEMDRLLRL